MKIALLGCKGTTLDLLHGLRMQGALDVRLVITLPGDKARRNKVSSYAGDRIVRYHETAGIATHLVPSYDLHDEADLGFSAETGIDVLLVIGWERLIPTPTLLTLGECVVGMHGSAFGLPKGRGRSPMNWALLTGHRKFTTYLFRYGPGIDDGDVLGFRIFDINDFDDIASLHSKNRIAMLQLVHAYLPLIARNEAVFWRQPQERPTYYPKRTAEDGWIDWTRPTVEVHRLIRAVAPPYPGAFCFYKGRRLVVLEAAPFDSGLFHGGTRAGTIVDVCVSMNRLVVTTGDGTLLITRCEGLEFDALQPGDVLEGGDYAQTLSRIRTRYPAVVGEDEKEI